MNTYIKRLNQGQKIQPIDQRSILIYKHERYDRTLLQEVRIGLHWNETIIREKGETVR